MCVVDVGTVLPTTLISCCVCMSMQFNQIRSTCACVSCTSAWVSCTCVWMSCTCACMCVDVMHMCGCHAHVCGCRTHVYVIHMYMRVVKKVYLAYTCTLGRQNGMSTEGVVIDTCLMHKSPLLQQLHLPWLHVPQRRASGKALVMIPHTLPIGY